MNSSFEQVESERLQELNACGILDTIPEPEFDDIADLATIISGCPIAMVTFVDENRQWFKARLGIQDSQTPRDISFCSHAILQDNVFIVENALADNRFKENPLVTGGIRLRFYAGAPIFSNGQKVGTVCIIDKRERVLLPKQIEGLKKLAAQTSCILELRKLRKQLKQD